MDDRFEAFSTSHCLVLALFFAAIPALLWQGRRVRGTPAEERSRRIFAVTIIATAAPLQTLQLLPDDWSLDTSLPLQLCDLAWVAAAFALWTRRPWACALTYYWGLTLTSQALVTPALSQPFPHPRFIGYWSMHLFVVWAAIYLTAALRVRPSWRLYASTIGVTIAWMGAVIPFNVACGTNYGYLNGKPSSASILDALPPWPAYVLVEVGILIGGWALMTWPWVRARARQEASGPPPARIP